MTDSIRDKSKSSPIINAVELTRDVLTSRAGLTFLSDI